MKRLSLTILFSATLILSGCRNETQTADERVDEHTNLTQEDTDAQQAEGTEEIRVQMQPKSNSNLSGTVVFTEENGEVTMEAEIHGLSEGKHAIHLHENADCSAEDASSAGGHWNPTFEDHGEWGDPDGYHKGDIGNFEVDSEGRGTITFSTDEWCIGCDDNTKNVIGKSVVVHDGVDDFTSQPSGDAGTRVGCGEITR